MSLTLGWPGGLNLSYVVIDPTTKRVFTNDLPLPTECHKLNKFENRYVNITEVFNMFTGTVQDEARWALKDLLEKFNVQQLVSISSTISEPKVYLPLSTFLAFVMIWPCCKAFQSLYKAIQQFLENSLECLCPLCGWTKRECNCDGKHSKNINIFLGYFKSQRDASCQTDTVDLVSQASQCTTNSRTGCHNSRMSSDETATNVCNSHMFENTTHIASATNPKEMECANNSSYSVSLNGGINYVQPLVSVNANSGNESSIPNVYNVTPQGYHSVTSKKRKRCQLDEEGPSQKNPNSSILDHANRPSRKVFRPNEMECETNMFMNLRGAGDRNGESSFWRLVEDSNPGSDLSHNKSRQPGDFGAMFKRFRHTVFGDIVLRCLVQNCGQCFDTLKAVELHGRTHMAAPTTPYKVQDGFVADTYYKCTECSFQSPFPQWHNMLRHLENEHSLRISNEVNSCGLCGLDFVDRDRLEHHMEFHSNSHYRCMFCGITLFSWHQVEMHLDTCTKRVENTKDQKLDIGCPYCSVVFQKKNVRNIHLMSHTDQGLTCMFCEDKVPRTWKALKKHYDLKHAKQVKKINITSEKNPNWHGKESNGAEMYCEKCSFIATSASLLKIHMNRKHASSDFSCSECDLTLASYHQLKAHMARHALEATLVCQHCDREFARRSDLRQHVHKDHLDILERVPESCTGYQCDSRLTNKSQAKRNLLKGADHGTHSWDQGFPAESRVGAYPLFGNSTSKIIPNGSSVGKRGRKRKARDVLVDDEKAISSQRELVERMRLLLRDSSARTRSFEEHKIIKNLSIETNDSPCDTNESRLVSSPSTASISEDSVILLPAAVMTRYPLNEHSYCKTEALCRQEADVMPMPTPSQPSKHARKPEKKNKPSTRAASPALPETPTADNCVAFPLRTTRRQAAIASNKVSICYSPPDMNSYVVAAHNPLNDWDLDSMTPKMTESELLAENELLKGLGDYGFLQDMLTSLSPSKNRRTSVGGLAVPSDLESIALFDEDLRLLRIEESNLNGFSEHFPAGDGLSGAESNSSVTVGSKSNARENGKLQQNSHCYS